MFSIKLLPSTMGFKGVNKKNLCKYCLQNISSLSDRNEVFETPRL